jgi:hypothetical protein
MVQNSIDIMLAEFRKKRNEENERINTEIIESKIRRQAELDVLFNRNKVLNDAIEVEEVEDEKIEETRDEEIRDAEEKNQNDTKILDSISNQQIIDVIKSNPEGIKLSAIGKELGVHYVAIATQIKELVDSGKIWKDNLLYKFNVVEFDNGD